MHTVALRTLWYNCVNQHKSLKGLSPAIAARLSETLWSMADPAEMIDATLPNQGKRGWHAKVAARRIFEHGLLEIFAAFVVCLTVALLFRRHQKCG